MPRTPPGSDDPMPPPGRRGWGAPPAPEDGPGEPARRRGREPGSWPAGMGPGTLEEYRARFGLSEKRLADHLGVSVPALRAWTKGGKAPSSERHERLRALLGRDYEHPAGARPGPPDEAASPGPVRWDLDAGPSLLDPPPPDRDEPDAEPGDAEPAADAPEVAAVGLPQAVLQLAAAYVRTPGGQHLSPDALVELVGRIRRTLA